MPPRIRPALALALAAFAGLAPCANAPANPDQDSCALVWSIPAPAANVTDMPDFDKQAADVNDRIALAVLDNGTSLGFALKPMPQPLAPPPTSMDPSLMATLEKLACLRQVWVSHQVGGDAKGAGYFELRVSVVRFVNKGEHVTWVYDFDKRYRFAGLPEVRKDSNGVPLGATVFGEILVSHALDATYAPSPDSVIVHEEYRRRVAHPPDLLEIHARHIVTKTAAAAQSALARVKAGQPFANVARAVSVDTSTKAIGGDLGWRKADDFGPDIASTVTYLEPRGLSPVPIETSAGWEVIEVMESRRTPFPSFDELKTTIAAELKAAHAKAQTP